MPDTQYVRNFFQNVWYAGAVVSMQCPGTMLQLYFIIFLPIRTQGGCVLGDTTPSLHTSLLLSGKPFLSLNIITQWICGSVDFPILQLLSLLR